MTNLHCQKFRSSGCYFAGNWETKTTQNEHATQSDSPPHTHTHLILLIIRLSVVCVCLPLCFRVSWLHFSAVGRRIYRGSDQTKQCNKSRNFLACSYTLAPSSRKDTCVCLHTYIVHNLTRIGALFIRRLRWIHTLGKENERDSQLCFLSFYLFLTASVGSSCLRVTWASSSFFCTLFTRYVIFQR